MTTPVIIDSDAGIDDVVALALAARSPELDLRAITTTYGNATLEATTRNVCYLLRLAGRDEVAVHPGSDRPTARPLVTAPETHGETGVGYAPVPPERSVEPNPLVLVERLGELSEPVTLLTLGPLTNLAHALDENARLVRSCVEAHVGMFGNVHERGNTNRWADYNAWCDPEAAERVLRAGLPTTMVGLDATRRMTLSRAEVDRLVDSDRELVGWLGRALRFYVEFHRRQERLDGCVVNDVLPVGELLHPGLLVTNVLPLRVELDESEHRGHTRERPDGIPTTVALGVNIARMQALLAERVWAGDAMGSPEYGVRSTG